MNTLSQVEVEVSKPNLTLRNDSLIIEYSILGIKPEDMFKVWLEIADKNGTNIQPKTIFGDIGDSISGDSPKKIIWNLAADKIFMNIDLSVEVFVIKIIQPALVGNEKEFKTHSDTITEADIAARNKTPESFKKEKTSYKNVKLGSNLLLSTLLPGWGLTRLSAGRPYWTIGVVSYGCIASSIYLNVKASSNYDRYLESHNVAEFNSYYNTGKKQYAASNILACSAAVIWIADLGLTWIKGSSMKESIANSKLSSFSLGSSYSYSTNTQLLSVIYTFNK